LGADGVAKAVMVPWWQGANVTSWRPATLAAAFLLLHATVWTLYAVLSNKGAVHGDMLEAYSWGREFQLGYFKHPPFWAWIAGAWFEVFPRSNWAFYLLGTLNSGIGVIGAWRLIGLLARDADRFNATALLLLLPAYTVQGHQYNANFILVSLWPWTAYFFVLSMEKRTLLAAALFGALAAASMLSKYYSAMLLVTCFGASFLHPQWRRYYRSAAPYLSVCVCLLLIAPHVWWAIENGFPTLKYAESKRDFPSARIYLNIFTFAAGCIGLNIVPSGLVALARLRGASAAPYAPVAPSYKRFVASLALGPFLLTLLSAPLGHFRISTNFASPIFFLMPLLAMQMVQPPPMLLRRVALTAVAILYGSAIVIAPALPHLYARLGYPPPKPAIAVAHEAKRIWSDVTHRPLRIVGGSAPYGIATAFYGGDDTSDFADFDQSHSPWVTDAAIARGGLLSICEADDRTCIGRTAGIAGSRREIGITVPSGAGSIDFRLTIIPPRPAAPEAH
jgi:4-amino-4-deoxy-L-arabinose transferase-like glycosyltransferase